MPTYFPEFPKLPRLPNPAAPLKAFTTMIEESREHLQQGQSALVELDQTRRQIGSLVRSVMTAQRPM